jgi:hypothetical protein
LRMQSDIGGDMGLIYIMSLLMGFSFFNRGLV